MTDVTIERRGSTLLITLNRPESRNAINTGISTGLGAAFEELERDPLLAAAVITGAGGIFCSGMDLKEFARSGPPKGLHRLLRRGSSKPLVAAVEGAALGGGLELALLCDLVVAAEDAVLGLPEVRVGLFAGGGGLLRLPRRLPYGVAAELVLTGEPIDSATASRNGLVNRVAAPGSATEVALELAAAIGRNAPLATAASKQLLVAALASTDDAFWEHQASLASGVFGSADAKEGPRAFAEKRQPVWTGA